MSGDISSSRFALIAQARSAWIQEQQIQKQLTGKEPLPVPSDEILIASIPPLSEQIQQLELQEETAASANSSPVAAKKTEHPNPPDDQEAIDLLA